MHRRDFFAAQDAIGTFLLSPASAQTTPKKGGTMIWGHSEITQNLDIHQSGTATNGRLLQNIHATLVTPDKNLRPVPALAESFDTSADLLTFMFKLRPNVKFHDGSTLSSSDVKYSFERVRDPKLIVTDEAVSALPVADPLVRRSSEFPDYLPLSSPIFPLGTALRPSLYDEVGPDAWY